MTSDMTVETARGIINQHAPMITIFANYVNDIGIGVQLLEAMTGTMYGTVADARTLLSGALQDIEPRRDQSASEAMIDGAASLEFLVRFARMIGEAVLPRDVIPSDEVVSAALVLFHAKKKETVS